VSLPVVLGLDLGTSGLKAVALDAAGRTVAECTHGYPLSTPRPGWTEQHPADWVRATRDALKELAETLSALDAVPVALGLGGQMHGLVPLDARGEVIRPAMLWNDQRTGKQVQQIEASIGRRDLVARTGNRAVTGFQLPKMLWMRDEEPELFARLRHALLPKDYLGYVLTGQMATEPSDASGVGALNLSRNAWDADLLRGLGLAPGLFPAVHASVDVTGHLSAQWAQELGLPTGLPVVAGGGDNAAAGIALGLTGAQPDVGSLSLGTSGVIFAPLQTPTPDPEGRVHLFAHADGGFLLLGVTLSAAGSLHWLQGKLAPGTSIEQLIEEATATPSGAEGVSFLPYLAGERSPLMNPEARAAFSGLSLAHGRGHLVRAVLEGTAASLADTYDVIRPLAPLRQLLSTGGGSRSDLWLGLVSGALGVPVVPTRDRPGAANGAAILAMPAGGLHPDLQAAMATTRPGLGDAVSPQDMTQALAQYRQLRRTLYPTPGTLPSGAPEGARP
jgi:xylulokinase